MDKKSLVFMVIFALGISEMATADDKPEPKICEKNSKMYSGVCFRDACDRKCRNWERAIHGACHLRDVKYSCYCYYDCNKVSPPKDGSPPAAVVPAPPGIVVSPPPPAGGGSPPPPAGGGSPPVC